MYGKIFNSCYFHFFFKTLAITENIPFNESSIKKSYKLTNGDIIFIEQYERGNRIWKKDMKTKTYNQVAFIWNFISLAKNCEGIKEKNIYFAQNLEYWLGGGAKIDDPQIRIF